MGMESSHVTSYVLSQPSVGNYESHTLHLQYFCPTHYCSITTIIILIHVVIAGLFPFYFLHLWDYC